MRSRRTVAATLLVIGLATALALVSLDPGEAPAVVAIDTTTTAAGAATTPLATAEPTTTTARAAAPPTGEGPPLVDLQAETFEDLRAVWDQIDAYWAWLNAHPTDDPEVLGVIFHPEGIEYARQAETLGSLERDGLRLVAFTAIGEVTAFGCCPDPQAEMDRGSITLAIRTAWPGTERATLTDSDGLVLETFPGWRLQSWLITLRRSDNGHWLVAELDGQ